MDYKTIACICFLFLFYLSCNSSDKKIQNDCYSGGIVNKFYSIKTGEGEINLIWDDMCNAEKYNVYYDSDTEGVPYEGIDANEGGSPILAEKNSCLNGVCSITITGLTEGKQYFFSISALCGGIETEFSKVIGRLMLNKPIPDAGQEKCYNDDSEIGCPSPGEPFYGQDANYITHKMSFTDNEDGTITDNVTGLMWQKQNDGIDRHWPDAISYCDNLILAGYTDWILPNAFELQSILNYGEDPQINKNIFPIDVYNNHPWFWTSDEYSENVIPDYSPCSLSWRVVFGGGHVDYSCKQERMSVLCVRCRSEISEYYIDNNDGTVIDKGTGLMWQKEVEDQDVNWEEALKYCEELTLAHYNDWKLPDIKELYSIVDINKSRPSIDEIYFPNTQDDFFWSSTKRRNISTKDVSFETGRVFNSNSSRLQHPVRCVRQGY